MFVVGGAIDDGGDADSGFGSRDVFVVVASAVNQDGRSSALTAPHGPSQQTLLADVAREERANAAEETRDDASRFVAMHGTGTGLGDPIETAALSRRSSANVAARSKRVDETRQHVFDATPRLVLNAPKAHYGHTEGAAGVAGLLAAAGHLARGESAPARHLRVVNPFVASALDAAGFFAPGAPRGRIAAPTRDATNARRRDVQFRHERRQRARRRDSSRKIRIASNVSFRHRWTERRDSRRRDSTRASIRVFPQTAPFTGRVATRARRRRGRVRRTFGRRASLVRERSHRDGNGVVPRGGGRFGVRGDVARRRDGRSGTVRRRRGDDVRGAARVDWIFQGGGEDADSDSTRSR